MIQMSEQIGKQLSELECEALRMLGKRLLDASKGKGRYNVFRFSESRGVRREVLGNVVARFVPTDQHMLTITLGYCKHEYAVDEHDSIKCAKCGESIR